MWRDQCIDARIYVLNLADVRVNHFNWIDLSVPDQTGEFYSTELDQFIGAH